MGAWSNWRETDRQARALERQREDAQKAYGYGKDLSDRQYGLQKGEALWQIGMQDRGLREGMDQFTGEYNTRLLARAYGEQDARMQAASGIGASIAQEGMRGTRGNEANRLERDYAAASLERQIGLQRRQDEGALAAAVQGANRSAAALGHERESWGPGGYREGMKNAQDAYNKKMSDLGISNLDWQLEDMNGWENQALNYTAAAFGGASSGLSLGMSGYSFYRNWW
jgi:hypothetical protein